MDFFSRLLVFSALGLSLLVLNVWFVRLAYSAVLARDFVIAPIALVSAADAEKTSGTALAQLLQARLKTLEHQLAETDSALVNASEQPAAIVIQSGTVSSDANSNPILLFKTVRMPTALLSGANVNISVGGVQVGGLLPVFERFLARPRQLSFSISPGANGTLVTAGDIQPMVTRGAPEIWLETKGQYVDAIDDLAFAILQRRLGEDETNRVDSLTPAEFKALVGALIGTADLNRRAASGRTPDQADFKKQLDVVKPIVGKVPDWVEVTYFAAVVADRADERQDAIDLYERILQGRDVERISDQMAALVKSGQIKQRVDALTVLRDFGSADEFPLAKPSPSVNAARSRIHDDIEFAATQYRVLLDIPDVSSPTLLLLEKYNNTFWTVDNNVYVTPVAAQHTPDVTYHEVAHPFVAKFISVHLATMDAAALTESFCDVLSTWVKQKKLGQTAENADWEIGKGVAAWLDDKVSPDDPRALRSLKTGEVLFPERRRPKYERASRDTFEQLQAGIPNHAFYATAVQLGTDTAIEIWRDALKVVGTNPTFPNMARITVDLVQKRGGEKTAGALRDAWRQFGVAVQ